MKEVLAACPVEGGLYPTVRAISRAERKLEEKKKKEKKRASPLKFSLRAWVVVEGPDLIVGVVVPQTRVVLNSESELWHGYPH